VRPPSLIKTTFVWGRVPPTFLCIAMFATQPRLHRWGAPQLFLHLFNRTMTKLIHPSQRRMSFTRNPGSLAEPFDALMLQPH